MDSSLTASWLLCGAFMVVFSAVGLSVISLANVPLSYAKLKLLPGMVLQRPLVDLNVAVTTWVLMGWAMANGGDTGLFVGVHEFATVGLVDYNVWYYQLSLLFVSLSIVSAASLPLVATSHARLAVSLFYALAVFPILFHWMWSAWGWASAYRSVYQDDLLLGCGVIDTGGASVIHMSAGCTGLVLQWMLKRRPYDKTTTSATSALATAGDDMPTEEAKEDGDDKGQTKGHKHPHPAHRHSGPGRVTFSATFAPLCLWVGYIGMNVATNLPANNASYVGLRRLIMTVLSGGTAFAMGVLLVACGYHERPVPGQPREAASSTRAVMLTKCFLSGLVAVGASCSTCELEGAATIGIVAAMLCVYVTRLQRYVSVGMDASDMAVSVHYVNGAWGLIAAGLLTSQGAYESTYADAYGDDSPGSRSTRCYGAFYGGIGWQLAAQCVAVLTVLAWAVCTVRIFVGLMWLFSPSSFADVPAESLGKQRYAVGALVAFKRHDEGSSGAKAGNETWWHGRVVDVHENYTYDIMYKDPMLGEVKSVGVAEARMKPWDGAKKDLLADAKQVPPSPSKMALKSERVLTSFKDKYGYSWDYAIVLDSEPPKEDAAKHNSNNKPPPYTVPELRALLARAGPLLETRWFHSNDRKQTMVKVRATVKAFRQHARETNYPLRLDEEKTEAAALAGDPQYNIRPFVIADGIPYGATQFRPYESIYLPYSRKSRTLFENTVFPLHGEEHPFASIHRLKLLRGILEGRKDYCCKIDLDRLAATAPGKAPAFFPLHHVDETARLRRDWLGLLVLPWEQPNDDIRAYFGEAIALYFSFIAYFTSGFGLLSLVSFGVCVHVAVDAAWIGNLYAALQTVYSVPAYALFLAVWTNAFLLHWRQKETDQAFRWGMDQFEDTEVDRKSFHGVKHTSYINGRETVYFPPAQARNRLLLSIVVTIFMIGVAIAAVAGVFALKYYVVYTRPLANGEVLANFVNLAQITLLQYAYSGISKWLNEQENCRTDTIYEDSLIVKLFAFNVINAYAAVFYIAFIKEAVGDFCVMDSCVGELAQAIVTIFGTRLLQAPINQLLVVQVTRMCFGANRAGMRATEKEFHMAPHSEVDIIGDYNSLAINFGFATLFGSVVPVAPLILFVSTFFEIRIDGYRLLMECRRPAPTGRQDIGSWYPIFSALSFAAVFTNAALVFVTGNYFDWLAGIKKLAAAAIACILVFAARMTYAYLIGGETAKGIDIQKQRRAHVIKKLIDKVPDPPEEEDEDDEALDATVKVWLQEDKDDELTNGYDATRGGRLPPEK